MAFCLSVILNTTALVFLQRPRMGALCFNEITELREADIGAVQLEQNGSCLAICERKQPVTRITPPNCLDTMIRRQQIVLTDGGA